MKAAVLIAAFLSIGSRAEAADLCVKPGGNDGTAKGSVVYLAGDEAGSTCWATLGRAMWGSTTRSSPSSAAAASAGDTVFVFGGTYTNTLACSLGTDCRFEVLYDPINAGTSGSLITVTCVGTCVLGAQNWNGPAIGSDGSDYVKWYADRVAGHIWSIRAYAHTDEAAASNEVNVRFDTGPVTCLGATGVWIEGADLDGGLQTNYDDNYDGIRVEGCPSFTARNNRIWSFRNQPNNRNGACFAIYHAANYLVEHTRCSDSGSGLIHKDNGTLVTSGTLRRNVFANMAAHCISWSIVDPGEEQNVDVYQNICDGAQNCFFVTGTTGATAADVFNNTCYNLSGAAVFLGRWSSGSRFWNNIVHTSPRAIQSDTSTMPAASDLDLEHNVYYNITTSFYTGSDGSRTLANFNAAYAGQHADAPAPITSDPIFVSASSGDFRLCTGVGTPHAGCAGASPALAIGVDVFDLDGDGSAVDLVPAGAYVTGAETIGLQASAGGTGRGKGRSRSRIR